MENDTAYILYFTEQEINETFSSLKEYYQKPHNALEIILKSISEYVNASDFVFNYYTEGKIFKKLPSSGSVAYFIINVDNIERLKNLTQPEHFFNILNLSLNSAQLEKSSDNKNSIKNFEELFSSTTRKYILEHQLNIKEKTNSVKL